MHDQEGRPGHSDRNLDRSVRNRQLLRQRLDGMASPKSQSGTPQPVYVTRPPKPVSEMSEDELAEWARQVIEATRLAEDEDRD
jgi:hypothetical protein